MPPARGHLYDARADLRWPDQRPEGHGACQPHAAGLQDGDQVHRPDRGNDPGRGQNRREQPHHRHAVGQRLAGKNRRVGLGHDELPAGLARDSEKGQRQGHHEMQAGIGEAGAAPADGLDEPGRQRPADGAGESAPEGQLGDRAPRLAHRRAVRASRRPRRRDRLPCRRRATPRRPDRSAPPAPWP